MKCSEVRLELADLVRGRSAGEIRQRSEEHLSACAECREEARQMEEFFRAAVTPPWAPPATYWASILPRVHAGLEERPSLLLPRWATAFALPLAAAVVMAVGLFKIAPRAGADAPENISLLLAQLSPEELQEVKDQQAVSEVFHPGETVPDQAGSSADDDENVKAIIQEEGGGTTELDAEVATGLVDVPAVSDAETPPVPPRGVDSLR